MREINRQLMQISNPRGAGSTQNKAQKYEGILMSNNRGYGHHLNSQREKRDRSTGSNNSKSRAAGGAFKAANQGLRPADGSGGAQGGQKATHHQGKLMHKNQQHMGGATYEKAPEHSAKYQTLLLSKKS